MPNEAEQKSITILPQIEDLLYPLKPEELATESTLRMYRDDDEAHAAAMDCFDGDGEDTPTWLPALYSTDDEAYAAALDAFEGVC